MQYYNIDSIKQQSLLLKVEVIGQSSDSFLLNLPICWGNNNNAIDKHEVKNATRFTYISFIYLRSLIANDLTRNWNLS